jgi:predicted PurR-regulated permease PerM
MTATFDAHRITTALTWAGLALVAWLAYLIVEPFLMPLAWAAVLAIVAFPVYERLSRRMRAGRAAALTTLGVTFVVIVPTVALLVAFVREALEIAASLQGALTDERLAWVESTWDGVGKRFPLAAGVDLAAAGSNALRQIAAFVVGRSGSIAQNIAGVLFSLALALFATFFLLRDNNEIMAAVRQLLPMAEDKREVLISRTRDLIWAGVLSSMAVAGLQGVLGGIAFAIVGIDGPVFWGVVMGFLCLLPFGAGVVWLPAAIMLAVGGHTTRAVILVVLGVGAVSTADNIVRPMLLSGKAQMNALVILISLLGGMSVFGLLGLVIGPVIVVTALSLVTGYLNHDK